jgi:hypothetical protein
LDVGMKFRTMIEGDRYVIIMTDDEGRQVQAHLTVDEARDLLREMAGDFDSTLCDGYCHEHCGSNE